MRGIGWILAAALFVAGCGGGGGGGGSTVPVVTTTVTPTATPTPAPPTTSSIVVTAGATAQSVTFGTVGAGYSGSLVLPQTTSGSGQVTSTLSAVAPAAAPALASAKRLPRTIGGSPTGLEFVQIVATANLTFGTTPSFTFTLPAGVTLASGSSVYVAFYDPNQSSAGWQVFLGPGTVSGTTITFASVSSTLTFLANTTYIFACFSTSQPFATPTPTPSPTPSPTPPPSPTPTPTHSASPTPTATSTGQVSQTGFACPSSDGTMAVARSGGSSAEAVRRSVRHAGNGAAAQGLLAVTYDRGTALATESTIRGRENSLGARLVHSYDFAHTNVVTRVISVPIGQLASVAAMLRGQSGVRSVGVTGQRRYASTVSQGFFPAPNDPYFVGSANNALRESAGAPGQWDMHVIGLEDAFAYSQANNGSGLAAVPNALGSSSVKIAIIDTGEDTLHPELSVPGKIAGQHCFITDPNSVQSTSAFSTDPDGHGTDVSGIAAAAMGNGVGFVGAGGNVSIYAYRVFPTPDNGCLTGAPNDLRCSATGMDIAASIEDAIAQNVNVISMSLGGGGCTNGQDDDPVEGQAVNAAIAKGIVVVVASGNEGLTTIDAPACVTGVIAVGATSLDDGQAIGTSRSTHGTAGSPIEYVAGYSNYDPTHATTWGIVAPGGDPSGNLDADDLHWIENIWTQTPFTQNDSGQCTSDFGTSGPSDCRTLIAGTSMATPHVAGAAALILSVNASYQSATAMKALLCQTADNTNDPHQGCGRLNVYRAMATALGDAPPP